MGVEYAHGIFVADLMWRPTRRHVDAVCSLLDRIFERDAELPAGELPANLVIEYAETQGPHIAKLMGPSLYDAADEDRYIQSVTVAFGSDFKQPVHERAEPPLSLPRNGATPIDPIDVPELGSHIVYPATWQTTPPEVQVLGSFWRCGVAFYCGKDIPAFAQDSGAMPATFVRALARAFDTGVVEHGWYC